MKVGIDLGTTNSLVCVWGEHGPELVKNIFEEYLTPSVIGFDDNQQIIVGLPAKERLLTHPHLTIACFKRYMGSPKITKLGQREFRPEELSSIIIRSLIDDVQRQYQTKVTEAIITVPAYFNNKQRHATKVAGQLAGIKVNRLLNEPTAAALTYGVHEKAEDSKFVIVDIGGGTFDVSVLDMFVGIVEVLASGGDNFLGGEDFTLALVELIKQQIKETFENLDPLDALIKRKAEAIKKIIQSSESTEYSIHAQGLDFKGVITKKEYLKITENLLKRIIKPISQTIRDSNLKPSDISHVVMVGGASRMPMFRQEITRLFGMFPHTTENPDHAIAIGCGIFVGLTNNDVKLEEVVLTDVMPYSLGIEISKTEYGMNAISGFYLPIIERNQHVPISRVESVSTISDKQKMLKVNVYQGERPVVKDNILIGSVEVPIQEAPAGEEGADIRFSYDTNGLLEVEITTHQTGEKITEVFHQSESSMTEEEVNASLKKLKELKIHPLEDVKNTAILYKAERIYEEHLGEIRELLSEWIYKFRKVLYSQNTSQIEEVRAEISNLLDQIENQGDF